LTSLSGPALDRVTHVFASPPSDLLSSSGQQPGQGCQGAKAKLIPLCFLLAQKASMGLSSPGVLPSSVVHGFSAYLSDSELQALRSSEMGKNNIQSIEEDSVISLGEEDVNVQGTTSSSPLSVNTEQSDRLELARLFSHSSSNGGRVYFGSAALLSRASSVTAQSNEAQTVQSTATAFRSEMQIIGIYNN
jgi:hypothetical protein